MLHWYRLARAPREKQLRTSGAHSHLIADRGGSLTSSLSPEQRRKLFLLGFAESVPLVGGGIFAAYTDSAAVAMLAAVIAMLVTALVCWLLRHQVPLTRIELTTQRPNQSLEPTAGRREVHI